MESLKILKTFAEHKKFLISTHVNPDPDALAAELALYFYLKALGKSVYVVNEEKLPQRFLFLPGARVIRHLRGKVPGDFDVVIVVDCGELRRIGSVQKMIAPGNLVVNIDHHVTNDFFGCLNLVVPKASSSAEVIFDLLKRARFALNKEMATLLYVGLMTDTGSFCYDNTSAHTHAAAGELMKFDVPISDLYRRIYESVPLPDMKHFWGLVSQFKTFHDGRVIYLELRKATFKKFSEQFDLRDKIFRCLRTIEGVELLVILTEEDTRHTKVNLRSQGKMDVARLAQKFHGGGHRRASGCFVKGNLPQAKKRIFTEIKKFL